MKLQVGDLILVRGTGPLERVIEWAENGKYSHVALYAGNGQVLEAQGLRKVGYAPLSQYEGKYDVGHVKSTPAQRAQALDYAQTMVGWPYDWRLIFYLGLKLVFHVNRPYTKRAAVICSSFVVDSWRAPGVNLTNADKPTPQDTADSPEITLELRN